MKRISKPNAARPVDPAAGFGRGVDANSLRLVRGSGSSWRAGLLGTAAAGALSFAIGGPAAAAESTKCVINGAIATCSGDQSAGIASGIDFTAPPVTTLNVNNLTKAITPASGTSGISFTSGGAISITSDTGAFGITTAGNRADGISGSSYSAVTVTSTGNITTNGTNSDGIIAGSVFGAVTVTSTGDITTGGIKATGIYARSMNSSSYTGKAVARYQW